jgi:hypothetical protein
LRKLVKEGKLAEEDIEKEILTPKEVLYYAGSPGHEGKHLDLQALRARSQSSRG